MLVSPLFNICVALGLTLMTVNAWPEMMLHVIAAFLQDEMQPEDDMIVCWTSWQAA